MDLPAVRLLFFEQADCSLEVHTRDFLHLACLAHYPNLSLCVFTTPASTSSQRHACLFEYIEWVLVNCGSPFTACLADKENASTRQHPEPSQPSAMPTAKRIQSPPWSKSQSVCLRSISSRSPSTLWSLNRCVSQQQHLS